jgi:cell fate (sporulation/competence/biofilm development) regulator YlbF (YheA/YmcA/DUF963 family)
LAGGDLLVETPETTEFPVDDIIQQAEKLGKALAGSDANKRLAEVREKLNAKPDLCQKMQQFQQLSQQLQQKAQSGQPIEPDEKHQLQSINDELAGDDVFKEYTAAQVEFVDLMRKVQQAVSGALEDQNASADQDSQADSQ